ncbi:hypothetical protein BCS91_26950 (plasmid) [Vibrio cyclitrophicus]
MFFYFFDCYALESCSAATFGVFEVRFILWKGLLLESVYGVLPAVGSFRRYAPLTITCCTDIEQARMCR